jgi:two-component system nitrogen regulation sensor histidine kinase NtrY
MNKKWTITWLTLIFTLFLILAIHAFHKERPFLLIASEIGIPLFYVITVSIFIRSLKPFSSMGSSLSLLKEGDFNITMVKTKNREVNAIIEIYNSMIKRLREERLSVREKNQFLDLLIESSPTGIIITDLDEKITHINKSAFKYLDISPGDYYGKLVDDLRSNLVSELKNLTYDEKQLTVLAGGQKFLCRKLYFMDSGFKHPFFLIEEFTEEIRKAEKVAYGKLIRMMAHEVNNTIGSVNSIMTTLQSGAASFVESEREDMVRMLGVAIQRNYQLNRFMQNFSNVVKLPPAEKEPMDLKQSLMVVIESFASIVKRENITLTTHFPESSVVISADRSQMELVFSNILKNSVEAITGKGEIIVSVKKNPLTIRFRDDGAGLSREVTDHIFTPFFSNKPGGQGIGLMLVQEILSNHDFTFSLRNRDPKGAEFIINC